MPIRNVAIGVAILLGSTAHDCKAHFLWLAADNGKALVFFGESAAERDYHMPESLSRARVHYRTTGKNVELRLKPVERDGFIGMVSHNAVSGVGVIETTCQYGVYHGSLLTYYAKHFLSTEPTELQRLGRSKTLRLDVVPDCTKDHVVIRVFWEGKPAKGASVSLIAADVRNAKTNTDDEGKAAFESVPNGLVGFLVSVLKNDCKGNIGGEQFTGASHFATVTFHHHGKGLSPMDVESHRAKQRPELEAQPPRIAPLPLAVASFGAAVSDNLYVYGGHIGEAHAHSRVNLANRFSRISFHPGSTWEELPLETPVQGLALVAHQGVIYRIGGMTANNASSEDDDLHSTTDFSRFHPKSKSWESLAPMPAARSSHDAVVIDDKLYVVGGWNLTGSDEGQWHTHSIVTDLAANRQAWERLPDQPFRRRALAVGYLDGKLIVVGGIDSNGDVSHDVDLYDPETSRWSQANPFPGEGMNGFGVSAWNLGGRLYASGSNGVVYRLTRPEAAWESVGQLKQPRFFHRLLPGPDGVLLAIGGASRTGHLNQVEVFTPPH